MIQSIVEQSVQEDGSLDIVLSMLTITDPDDSVFTITLYDGANFSIAGNTVIPNTNYNGVLSVNLNVTDGEDFSNTIILPITVTPVNDQVIIDSITDQTMDEDGLLALSIGMVHFHDIDSPSGSYSLKVYEGVGYSVSAVTIKPDTNFYGILKVPLAIADDNTESGIDTMLITVTPINDRPFINSTTAQSISEDGQITISTSMLSITDPDDSVFTLIMGEGANYSVSGNSVIPASDYYGVLSVSLNVFDGELYSNSAIISITVTPVNDIPNINSASTQTTSEDVQLTISTNMFSISDPDNSTFTPIIHGGENYTVSGNSIIPSKDFFGNISVEVSVTDGEDTSNTVALPVTVTAVKDKAVIDSAQGQSILEEASLTLLLNMVNFHDVDSTSSSYSLKVFEGDGYSVSGNTIQADIDRNGVLKIPVAVIDDDTESDTDTIQVSITPVNDAPNIDSAFAQSTLEDVQLTISTSMLSISDPDNLIFNLIIGAGSNYTIVDNNIVPSENFFGEILVPVFVTDGEDTSGTVNLPVSVTSVNDKAVIDSVINQTILEDSSFTLLLNMVSFHDIDSSLGSYNLKVFDGNWYSFSGNTIQPDENFNGVLKVPVAVVDNDTESDIDTILISISPVNDTPYVAVELPYTDTVVYVGMTFEHDFPAELFADPDTADLLQYDAISANGGALPSWLSFNGRRLKGTIRKNDIGIDTVRITATDPAGLSAYVDFTICIEPVTEITVVSNSSNRVKTMLSSSNPVNLSDGEVFFQIPSDLSGKGELIIMSVLGEILEQKEYKLSGGEILLWDLKDRNGNAVGSGTFLVMLRVVLSDGTRVVKKMLQGIKE